MRHIASFIAACLLFASVSCGNGTDGTRSLGSNSTAKGSSASSNGEGPGQSGNGESESNTNAKGSSTSPAPTASWPSEIPGVRAAPLEIKMKSDCVVPGRIQSMTVKTNPGFKFTYGTRWPDGAGHPDWAGAFGKVEPFPESGTIELTWAVPTEAPLGEARTDASVVGEIDGEDAAKFDRAFWEISKSC